MFDDRWFNQTYDLYRPDPETSTGGVDDMNADEVTYEDKPCRLFSKAGRLSSEEWGLDVEHDAILLVPYDADVKPEVKDDNPDQVVVGGVRYVVMAVRPGSGQTLYKRCFLKGVR